MFTHDGRPYIIAEIGANHNGDMDLARKMIDEAKACGADAVKFQSWDTTIFSRAVYEKNFFLGDDYRERSDFSLKEIVEEFAISYEEMQELAAYCRKVGIDFSSTPFNERQVQELIDLGAPYVKIASMDVNNHLLLECAAKTGLPVILSTGFAELAEIDHAVKCLEDSGAQEIVILHCISLYPPEDDEVNLENMETLRQCYGYPVGFSDHTLGTEIAIASLAKRAVVLEKHFTLDKEMFGWDHKVSSTPEEIRAICTARDRIHAALGSPRRKVGERERSRRDEYRRSIVTARPLTAGSVLRKEDVDFRRPGTGLAPPFLQHIVGMRLRRDLEEDTLLTLDDLAAGE